MEGAYREDDLPMTMMRAASALLAVAALAAVDARPAAAEIYRPWCVQYGGNSGDNGTTCAFMQVCAPSIAAQKGSDTNGERPRRR